MIFFCSMFVGVIVLLVQGIITSSWLYSLSGIILVLLFANLVIHYRFCEPDFLSPLFFFTMIFGVSICFGSVLLRAEGLYEEYVIIKSLLYSLVFVVCFVLGFWGKLGDWLSTVIPILHPSFSRKRLKVVTVIFVPLGIFLFMLVIKNAGFSSLAEIIQNLMGFRQASGAKGMAYVWTATLFLLQAPFWGWCLVGTRGVAAKLGIGLYGLLLIVFSLLSGSRGASFSLIMGMLIVYHCKYRMITLTRMMILCFMLVPAILFFGVQGQLRGAEINISKIDSIVSESNTSDMVVMFFHRFIDAFEGFVTIVQDDFCRYEMLWGMSFVDAMWLPIPRMIFPDKPYSFCISMTKVFYPDCNFEFFGADYSMLGEFYVNFHLAGILIGGLVFGVLLKAFHVYYMKNRKNISFIYLYTSIYGIPVTCYANGLINSEAPAALLIPLAWGSLFFALVWDRPKRGMAVVI